uniref:Protein FAR1-RELATED SEQUENCE n=1 Tax=Steinernema glaseri TaxID=37863 RepID=A0A1I8AJM8_9BILA
MEHKPSTASLKKAKANERFLFTNQDSFEDSIHHYEEEKKKERPFPIQPKGILHTFHIVDAEDEVKELHVHFNYNFSEDMLVDIAKFFRMGVNKEHNSQGDAFRLFDICQSVFLNMNETYGPAWVCCSGDNVDTFNRCYHMEYFAYLTLDGQEYTVYRKRTRCSIM